MSPETSRQRDPAEVMEELKRHIAAIDGVAEAQLQCRRPVAARLLYDANMGICGLFNDLLKRAEESSHALARVQEERQWQPIETAPKDGTTVLLWWRSEFAGDVVDWWACGEWKVFGDGSKGWIGESFYTSEPDFWTRLIAARPTHWMPLPSPPQEPT